MKNLKCYTLLLFVLFNAAIASGQILSGRDIMEKVDQRPDGDDRQTLMHMTLINKRGHTRERTVLSYSKDYGQDTKTLMYFQKPADVKGTGFLSWEYKDASKEDDRWLYLPALKKVRRISGSSKNDYFMGSDFTYDDMGDRSVDEDVHKLLKEESIEGYLCWIVESTPKDKDYMYSKVIHWIRQDSYTAFKIEYYNKNGDLLKVLTCPDVRETQGFWTIFRWEMNNLQEKHQTILELEKVDYDLGIQDNIFHVANLERGKIK